MSLTEYTDQVLAFLRANQQWAPFIAAALAFGESVVVVSFFVPAVGILFGMGLLIGTQGMAFWPTFAGIVIGASLGNLISWYVGAVYGDKFKQWKPIRERPQVVEASERFFKQYGFLGIFIGRFFGPLHGTIATVAAIAKMNPLVFHVSNWASAAIWAAVVLGAGAQGGEQLRRLLG
jgi:membrane protein DedA with SNARE-associated domain